MAKRVSYDQLARLAQIYASLAKGGEGFDRARAQRMIDDRTREAQQTFDDLRKRRAWCLFDKYKVGDILGGLTFEQYLDGTDAVEPIPFIPWKYHRRHFRIRPAQ